MEIISGYEGQDREEFIAQVKEIWRKEGTKPRGGKGRYKIIIGRISQRAALLPTVSTRSGTEIIIIWNLSQDDIRKIEKEAKKSGIPVNSRSYLWFNGAPTVLPNESREP